MESLPDEILELLIATTILDFNLAIKENEYNEQYYRQILNVIKSMRLVCKRWKEYIDSPNISIYQDVIRWNILGKYIEDFHLYNSKQYEEIAKKITSPLMFIAINLTIKKFFFDETQNEKKIHPLIYFLDMVEFTRIVYWYQNPNKLSLPKP